MHHYVDDFIGTGGSTTPYALVVLLLFCALVGLVLASGLMASARHDTRTPRARIVFSPWVLFAVATAFLLVMRLPSIFYPLEINLDESLMLAQARRLVLDPVPWRSADFGTGGPLLSYALLVPSLLGFALDYELARVLALLFIVTTLVLIYRTVRLVFDEPSARLACLPAVLFFGFANKYDYVHYSSELLPVVLIAGALFFASRLLRLQRAVTANAFLCGLSLGALPFSKLQALPIGAAIFCMVLIALILGKVPVPRLKVAAALLAGCLCIPFSFLLTIVATYSVVDVWTSSVPIMAVYGVTLLPIHRWVEYFASAGAFANFAAGVLAAAVLALVLSLRAQRSERLREALLPGLCLGYLLIAVFVVLKPGREYHHYLLFLIEPVVFLGALSVYSLRRAEYRSASGQSTVTVLLVLILLAPPVFGYAPRWLVLLRDSTQTVGRELHSLPEPKYYPWDAGGTALIREEAERLRKVVDEIRRILRSDDLLAIWGRYPSLYIYADAIPAVRDVNTGLAMMHRTDIKLPLALRKWYARRYLSDLVHSRPSVFIDAVNEFALSGDCFYWPDRCYRDRFAHETVPELASYVAQHYVLWREVDEAGKGVRLYVDKQRYEALRVQ